MTYGELKDVLDGGREDGYTSFDHALSSVQNGNYDKILNRHFKINGQLYILKRGYLGQLEFFDV